MQISNSTLIANLSALGQKIELGISNNTFEELFYSVQSENNWFTKESCQTAFSNIANGFLNIDKLEKFCSKYELQTSQNPKKIGLICAGNIPAVGFQDLIYTLISGNVALLKLSSTDTELMTFLINSLIEINPSLANYIKIIDRLNDADVFIATGSDNSSRYFEYYFRNKPHIIRKNRSSVAVIESGLAYDDYQALGKDIFQYYGLGCRNVSKIYVPENFDFTPFFEGIESFFEVFHHHKYKNNYDYNKSVLLINQDKFLDNGFLNVKVDKALVSPISVLHYETYSDSFDLKEKLNVQAEKIQCIVRKNPIESNEVYFGQSQQPNLIDFADGIDVVDFLSNI